MGFKSKSAYCIAVVGAAAALFLTFAGLAGADGETRVWGAQHQITDAQASAGQADIRVLNFSGPAGGEVFLSVENNGATLARYLAHALGSDGADVPADTTAGAADAFYLNEVSLAGFQSGAYTVKAYADRAGKQQLFSGAVYGVYAQLEDAGEVLMGTTTAASTDAAGFTAPTVYYHDGKSYRRAGEVKAQGNRLVAAYKRFDAASAVDGAINYVDENGTTVSSAVIEKIPANGSQTVEIPQVVKVGSTLYRTVSFTRTVTAKNPGTTEFTVPVIALSGEDALASGHYLATIKLVEDGNENNVIVADTLNVTGDVTYTAPSSIYKMESGTAVTYTLKGDATRALFPDPAFEGAHTELFAYVREPSDAPQTTVTFNLLDGRQRPGAPSKRSLGVKQVTVNANDKTAAPDAQISVDGAAYKLAGAPESYAFEYGSRALPVIDVYYVPDGYEPEGPYTVTINYVNVADGSVIASETAQSDPQALDDLSIMPPEKLEEGGETYVRLPGQETAVEHNYYSNTKTYTFYYRDSNTELSSTAGAVKTRVVYKDVDGTTTTKTTTTTVTVPSDSNAARAGTTSARLNQNRAYTSVGDEEGTLVTEEGIDSNTERIEEQEAPLSDGTQEGDADAKGRVPVAGIAAGVAIAALAGGFIVFARRRKNDSQ